MTSKVAVIGLLAMLVCGIAAPMVTAAEFGIVPGSLTIKVMDGAGDPDNRAGVHPNRLQIAFTLNTAETGTSVRDTTFELPPGLSGNPNAVPTCPREVFDGGIVDGTECPSETQVGVIRESSRGPGGYPIFNVEPAPGESAVLGFRRSIYKFPFAMRLRPDDYGFVIEQKSAQVSEATGETRVELWGVPADHQEGTGLPLRPFLTTPTRCDRGPLAVTFRTRSWEPSAPWLSATADTGAPLTGCQQLPFEPRIGFELTNPVVDAPTGARVDLTMPQSDDPDGRASSQIRNVRVALPEGFSLSPGAAEGHSACSDSQLGRGTEAEAACPPSSRVGTVELEGPQLREALTGAIYLGQERPGERFRIFVAASGLGIDAKLVGSLDPDPRTGRLAITLNDLPEIPFGHMTLRLDGGPRALLASPLTCGGAMTTATFVPYSGTAPVDSSDVVEIGGNPAGSRCPDVAPFAPPFIAGSTMRAAGRATSFSMTLQRRDGEQLAERFSVALPRGLVARLGSVEPCPVSAVAATGCPSTSRIGSVIAELGAGPEPAVVEGSMHLTGPYHRAPFGLALVFRAVVGPFDLGTLQVRGALRIDPQSGRVTVETDPLPRMIEGIPVRFQTIGLDIDRPGFLRNPTSCAPASVTATIRSTEDAVSHSASPFRVKGCGALRFRPSFSMQLTDRSELRRDGRPGFRVEVRSPPGGTNLRDVDILLPRLLTFDASGVRAVCARRDAIEGTCPPGSKVGKAYARSPMLSQPLTGSLYVVRPHGNGSPDMWASLNGLGVHMSFRSKTSVEDGRLKTRLVDLPDLPLTMFRMQFASSAHGVLSLRHEPCTEGHPSRQTVRVAAEGQNGASRLAWPRLITRVACQRVASPRASKRPSWPAR